jgi:hypothetical protein
MPNNATDILGATLCRTAGPKRDTSNNFSNNSGLPKSVEEMAQEVSGGDQNEKKNDHWADLCVTHIDRSRREPPYKGTQGSMR